MAPILGPIIIAVICILLIQFGRREPRYRFLAIGATGVLIFLGGTIVWRALLHTGLVSLDRFLGAHWQNTLEGTVEHLVFFGPPAVVTALAFLFFGKSLTPPARDDG